MRKIRCLYLIRTIQLPNGLHSDTIMVERHRIAVKEVEGGYEAVKGRRALFIPQAWCAAEFEP